MLLGRDSVKMIFSVSGALTVVQELCVIEIVRVLALTMVRWGRIVLVLRPSPDKRVRSQREKEKVTRSGRYGLHWSHK